MVEGSLREKVTGSAPLRYRGKSFSFRVSCRTSDLQESSDSSSSGFLVSLQICRRTLWSESPFGLQINRALNFNETRSLTANLADFWREGIVSRAASKGFLCTFFASSDSFTGALWGAPKPRCRHLQQQSSTTMPSYMWRHLDSSVTSTVRQQWSRIFGTFVELALLWRAIR